MLKKKFPTRSRLSVRQVQVLEGYLATDELEDALKMLRQVASHQRDDDLRVFCITALGDLARLQRDGQTGIIAREQANAQRNARLAAIHHEVLSHATEDEEYEHTSAASGAARSPELQSPPSAIRCEGLTKSFPRRFTLPAVSFDLRHGDILGVVGFNGSGKTTLLRMLAGDLLPTAGRVTISNRDDRGRLLRTRVTFVPQILEIWGGTLRDHLAQRAAFCGWNELSENTKAVQDVANLLGLEAHLSHRWAELSAGYRQRAAVAAALIAEPGVLVLDEPLAPMDPRAQQQLLSELHTRAVSAKTAIVISSQHVPEIESVATSIARIDVERVEISGARTRGEGAGLLFELGVPVEHRAGFHACLRRLQKEGRIRSFVYGMSTSIIRVLEPLSIESVIGIFDPKPMSIRDISRSAIAHMYRDLWESED